MTDRIRYWHAGKKKIVEGISAEEAAEYTADYHLSEEESHLESYPELCLDQGYRDVLFSEYAHLDTWRLYDEAVSMLYCTEPRFFHITCSVYFPQLKVHLFPELKASAGYTLKILNPEASEEEWRVVPKEFLKWALGKGWDVPGDLLEAMGIDSSDSSKAKKKAFSDHPNAEHHAQRRESVLAAALAVMVAAPEKCKKGDSYSPTAIAAQIDLFSDYLFGKNQQSPLTERVTADLISKAIRLIPDK